jgi:hypothetical protein
LKNTTIPVETLVGRVALLVRLVEMALLDLDVQRRLVVADELETRLAERRREEKLRRVSCASLCDVEPLTSSFCTAPAVCCAPM